jgi:hypothetical protein
MANWLDRMVRRVRDADTEEEAREVTKDFIDPSSGQPTGGGSPDDGDTHIHLHMGGKGGEGGGGMAGDDDPPIDVGGGGEPDVQQLAAAVAELLQRVEQLEGGGGNGGGGNSEGGEDGEDVELEDPETKDRRRFRMRRGRTHDESDIPTPERLGEDMVGETDLPGLEDLKQGGTGDRRKFRDNYARTHDSADAEDLWQGTMAAAEILQPGVKVPTFDARLTLASTARRLCAFRRRVLDHALSDENTKGIIHDSIGTIDTKTLTCDSVKMAFNAAAAQVRLMNRQGTTRTAAKTRDGVTLPRRGPPSIAEMNASAKEFWNNRNTNGASR